MSSRFQRFAALFALTGVLALAGCSSSKAPEQKPADPTPAPVSNPAPTGPTKGGTLTIGQSADVLTLDPALTTDEASRPVQSLLFNSLVKYNDKMEIIPDLAEKYEVKDNGLTYVFTLHKGVKFHNGDPMKASDVKFSIERMSDPELKSRWASFFTDVKEVKVVDENTVQLTLSQPNAAFINAVASYMFVLQESFVKANPNLQRVENGTGAFKLKEWVPNTHVTVTRFADYFEADKTHIETITFKIIPEEASRLAALRTGEVQFLEFLEPQFGPQLDQMKNAGTIVYAKVFANSYHMFGFNAKRAPFDNEKVRQAIQYAVDRETLLKTAALGQGAVSGILSPALGNWVLPVEKYPEYKRDLAKAKQLLKEAGYENGFEFKIMSPSNYPVDLNTSIALVEQLKEIGVTAIVDKVEWGTYVDRWVKRDFDTFVGHNGSGTDPDLAMYAALSTGGSTNAFQYSDAEIDELLKKGRLSANPAERKQTYDTIQLKLVEKGPMVYTFATYRYYAHSPKLLGYDAQVVSPFKNLAYAWIQN